MKSNVSRLAIAFVMACMAAGWASAQPYLQPAVEKVVQPVKEAKIDQSAPSKINELKEVASPAVTKPPALSGKVVETMNSGGYTYILVEKDGKKNWAAVPATKVSVGQDVQVRPGIEMGKFSSKSLNKTFDNIIFSSGLVGETAVQTSEGQAQALPGQAAKGMAGKHGSNGGTVTAGTFSGKVVESMNSGGYTYVSLENEGKTTWAAVPTMQVAVGEKLELRSGAVMTNFTSKTLNRTFEKIIFSEGPIKK